MKLVIEKALTPGEDWEFNQLHPRARGGKFGPKPMAEQLQQEAQAEQEVPDPEAEMEVPAESGTVASGTSDQDARVALSEESVKRLKLKKGELSSEPSLVVAFTNRADATKFAIACEHLIGEDATLRVTAGANGRYFVEPEGLNPAEINAVQTLVYFGQPLDEITAETVAAVVKGEEPAEESPLVAPDPVAAPPVAAEPSDVGIQAAAQGLDDTGRDLLRQLVQDARITEESLPEVLLMARAIGALSESRETGMLPVMEAVHYGSLEGLKAAADSEDLENATRARAIFNQIGNPHLEKGRQMKEKMLVKLNPDQPHDSLDYDGKAEPLGTKERVTDKVGEEPTITEKTTMYPRGSRVKDRKPRLILSKG